MLSNSDLLSHQVCRQWKPCGDAKCTSALQDICHSDVLNSTCHAPLSTTVTDSSKATGTVGGGVWGVESL